MATVNVDKMSLKDLIELEAKVQKAIGAARDLFGYAPAHSWREHIG